MASTSLSIKCDDVVFLPHAARASASLRRRARREQIQAAAASSEPAVRSRSRGRASRPGSRAASPGRHGGTTSPHPGPSRMHSGDGAGTPVIGTPRGGSPVPQDEVTSDTEDEAPPPPAILRGLLVLNLSKPSRIRRINLRFKGVARTEWPEGIGPRRLEVSEDTTLIDVTHPIFAATQAAPAHLRRANSMETGLRGQDAGDEQVIRSGRGYVRAASVMPGREPSVDRFGASYYSARDAASMPTRPPDTPSDDPPAFTDEPTSVIQVNGQDRDLTPPARPPLPHPSSSQSSRLTPSSRSAGIATGQSTGRLFGSRRGSTSSSIHQIDTIISESPLVQTPEHEHAEYPHQQEALGGAASAPVSSSARSSFDAPRDRDPTPPARPSFQGNSSHQRIATSSRSAGIEPHTQHHARFALPSLLKGKGRADPDAPTPEATASKNRSRSRGRQMNLKALREALVSSVDGSGKHGDDADEEDGEHQHNWREFKAGRYVWPIQLAIPVTLPPTLNATFGSVRYTLKAQVTRVGALTSNLTADTRVELVSSPGVDDTEETDSLVIERMWELQMRYLITVSGKAFPIGSKIPIAIRLNPLAKVKVYRIVATIEEKLSYYAHGRRIARHEGTRRFPLAKAENVAEGDEPALPVLPVFSDNADALLHSPLTPWIINATSNDDHAPSLLDPIGPWELETDLQIPNCKSRLHFSCKHPSANMEMTHILKLVLRVERGDREELDSKGQPKKFDIVIEAPIVLLSCRNITNTLPAYSTAGATAAASTAPAGECGCPAAASPDALARQRQFARLVSGAESETGAIPPTYDYTVAHPEESSLLSRSTATPPLLPATLPSPGLEASDHSPSPSPQRPPARLPSPEATRENSRGRPPRTPSSLGARIARSLSRAPPAQGA